MRNCLCIILFLLLSLTIPASSAYAYGGGGGDGGGGDGKGGGGDDITSMTGSTSSDTTKPPSGFTPSTQEGAGSEITTSSETDPGEEEEVAELVEEVNTLEEAKGDDKTNKSEAPYWTIGAHISVWISSNPVKAWRDSVVNRVPRGECCVDASKDRAGDIAAHLQSLVDSGELDLGDHTITIGSRSGYKVPLSGWLSGLEENVGTHTYTVIQIYDANGKFQGAWEADTYVTNHVLPHSEVDLVGEYPEHVKTVAPGKKG